MISILRSATRSAAAQKLLGEFDKAKALLDKADDLRARAEAIEKTVR